MSKFAQGILFFTIMLLALTAATFASGQMTKQPRIELSHDQFYFGFMPMNAIVQHSYWIRNKGNDTLQIISVKPGCGCTTAPLSKEKIAPDDSALLKVTFDSKNMVGKMVKDVEIFSNDPQKPSTSVRFFAVVNREHDFVRATPNALRFSKFGAKDGRMVKALDIKNGSIETIELKVVELPADYVAIDRKTAKLKPGETATFQVEQTASVTNEADVLTSLTVEFVGQETDRITIPIVAHLQK